MDKFATKNAQVQFVIIACYLLGTAFGASLFGIDLSAPMKIAKIGIEEMKMPEPPKISQLTQDYIQFSDSDTFSGLNRTSQDTGVTELVTDSSTLGCLETGTDNTTETGDYETTTAACESLNRVGGIPPNVVASLLG